MSSRPRFTPHSHGARVDATLVLVLAVIAIAILTVAAWRIG